MHLWWFHSSSPSSYQHPRLKTQRQQCSFCKTYLYIPQVTCWYRERRSSEVSCSEISKGFSHIVITQQPGRTTSCWFQRNLCNQCLETKSKPTLKKRIVSIYLLGWKTENKITINLYFLFWSCIMLNVYTVTGCTVRNQETVMHSWAFCF